ncbi:MAG: type II secretion system protein M [Lachnospiraceae bacterium]|nr:type II secretion system protein M [Lachnospiraceae bacterium]
MKNLSREFTTREKILLLVLAILLVLVVYYYLVDLPLRGQKESLTSELTAAQADYDATHAKYTEYLKMKADMEQVTEDTSIMASYNNRSEEIHFLDDLFKNTLQYSVGFSPVTVEGDQIRRAFTVSFTAASYDQAVKILERLADCHYRCVISDISCSGSGEEGLKGPVSVSCGAVFFETMVDRNTDAGLPVVVQTPVATEEPAE